MSRGGEASHFQSVLWGVIAPLYTRWQTLLIPQSYLQKICHMLGYPQVATPLALLFFSLHSFTFSHRLPSLCLTSSHLHISQSYFFSCSLSLTLYISPWFAFFFFFYSKRFTTAAVTFFSWHIGVYGDSHTVSQPIYTGSKIASLCPSLSCGHTFCSFWMF